VRPVSAKAPAPVAVKQGKAGTVKAPVAVSSTKPSAIKPVGSKAGSAKSLSPRGVDGIRFPENRPVPLAPVPTEGRPRKNQAGISSKDLENYRVQLLAKRRELVGDMSAMEREALRSTAAAGNLSNLPIHMADMGTDNYEQEFTLGLVEKDRVLLREINQALAKIQDGTYGICEGTGKPIGRPRLEAQPWARYSIEYARLMERGGIRK
jgi:DnaK suppressor protein